MAPFCLRCKATHFKYIELLKLHLNHNMKYKLDVNLCEIGIILCENYILPSE